MTKKQLLIFSIIGTFFWFFSCIAEVYYAVTYKGYHYILAIISLIVLIIDIIYIIKDVKEINKNNSDSNSDDVKQ